MNTVIRKGQLSDLDRIMEIYAIARQFMRKHDNPTQWGNNHPSRALIEEDIARGDNYVIESEGQVEAVFYFSMEKDPTYDYIEGKWLSPDGQYAVIHRIASSGKLKGVLGRAVEFGLKYSRDLRIDTHEDNYVMQNAIVKNGFTRCGIIYLENGEARIAYERI